jgi:hypothetical protein
MSRSAITLAALALLSSCEQSAGDRVRTARERLEADAAVARSDVVRSAQGPREPGRLIYDRPIDLSYATLRKTRPDLDSAHAFPGRPGATEAGSRHRR